MIVDPHSLQVPVFCLIWKSAPNILWSLGGAADNQFLQIRKDNLALMARLSLMSLYAGSKRPRLLKWLGGIRRLGYRTIH
jgi:hypothetical protein